MIDGTQSGQRQVFPVKDFPGKIFYFLRGDLVNIIKNLFYGDEFIEIDFTFGQSGHSIIDTFRGQKGMSLEMFLGGF